MIAWTIQSALQSKQFERLVLTTDDCEIAAIGEQNGCEVPFLRPQELALDGTPGIAPVIHAIEWLFQNQDYQPELVMLLQPTSPFRSSSHITEAVEMLLDEKADALVSIVEPHHHPQWMYRRSDGKKLTPFLGEEGPTCRQQLSPVYALNGSIYLIKTQILLDQRTFTPSNTIGYLMDKRFSLDLDDIIDWEIAESLAPKYIRGKAND